MHKITHNQGLNLRQYRGRDSKRSYQIKEKYFQVTDIDAQKNIQGKWKLISTKMPRIYVYVA